MKSQKKNSNKKINKMNMEEVLALMLKMQNEGHAQMKKYIHLQKRLAELNASNVAVA